MTLILIANVVLISAVVFVIVGMLAGAIATSRPELEVGITPQRAPRHRRAPAHARARAYRRVEGVNV